MKKNKVILNVKKYDQLQDLKYKIKTENLIFSIEEKIQDLINKHQRDLLDKELKESTKQFLKGCITGLAMALIQIPLKETLNVD
jgi:hypothetical protein